MSKNNLKTMSEVMNDLEKKGFTHNFRIVGNRMISNETKNAFSPEDVYLIHQYRFEGESNPGDSSILYALSTANGEKGMVINSYGVDADLNTSDFLDRIEEKVNH
jgi:hypothetical protein